MENMKKDWQLGKSLTECNLFMLENDISDVCFKLISEDKGEPVIVKAMKTLLIARSPVFFAMFCGEMKEKNETIELTDVDPEAFYELVRYIYTDEVKLTADNVMYVMHAADKYMVTNLVDQCKTFLTENLIPDNAAIILDSSVFYGDKELQQKSLQVLEYGAKKALCADSFANISRATLKMILESEKLAASELEMFKACVSWAKAQCTKMNISPTPENQRDALGQEFFLLRFTAMDVTEFGKEVLPHRLFSDKEGYALFQQFLSPAKPADLPFLSAGRKDLTETQTLCFSKGESVTSDRSCSISYLCETKYEVTVKTILFYYEGCTPSINLKMMQNSETLVDSQGSLTKIDMNGIDILKMSFAPIVVRNGNFIIATKVDYPYKSYNASYTLQQSVEEVSNDIIHVKHTGTSPRLMYGIEYSF